MSDFPPPPSAQIPPPGDAPGFTAHLLDNLTAAQPRQPSTVTLSRTETHLHIHFNCADTHPWATLTQRDAPLYTEEVVEVFLDPFGDLECYFEIEVNPLNTVLDLMLRRIGKGWRKEFAWSCAGLETTTALTDSGWTASLAIPFAAFLTGPPASGAAWRANFLRIDRLAGNPRELSAWSPTGQNTFHVTQCFGHLLF
jgi:hypothetical protein